jgi:hypothetical protein
VIVLIIFGGVAFSHRRPLRPCLNCVEHSKQRSLPTYLSFARTVHPKPLLQIIANGLSLF